MKGAISLGGGRVVMEFTNSKTGLVRTFTGGGVSDSVGRGTTGLIKWLSAKFGASYSPSSFPSTGEVITMLAARDPFYIDAIRGCYGQMVSGGSISA